MPETPAAGVYDIATEVRVRTPANKCTHVSTLYYSKDSIIVRLKCDLLCVCRLRSHTLTVTLHIQC